MTTKSLLNDAHHNVPVKPCVRVIVDMQLGFRASQNIDTIAHVEAEILRAIEENQPIIVLEFMKYPMTDERLRRHLLGYKDCFFKTKRDEDGSEEIIEACMEHDLPADCFRFCGVNTHECVQKTVVALAEKLDTSLVEVLKSCCNDEMGNDWAKFPLNANVVLI